MGSHAVNGRETGAGQTTGRPAAGETRNNPVLSLLIKNGIIRDGITVVVIGHKQLDLLHSIARKIRCYVIFIHDDKSVLGPAPRDDIDMQAGGELKILY